MEESSTDKDKKTLEETLTVLNESSDTALDDYIDEDVLLASPDPEPKDEGKPEARDDAATAVNCCAEGSEIPKTLAPTVQVGVEGQRISEGTGSEQETSGKINAVEARENGGSESEKEGLCTAEVSAVEMKEAPFNEGSKEDSHKVLEGSTEEDLMPVKPAEVEAVPDSIVKAPKGGKIVCIPAAISVGEGAAKPSDNAAESLLTVEMDDEVPAHDGSETTAKEGGHKALESRTEVLLPAIPVEVETGESNSIVKAPEVGKMLCNAAGIGGNEVADSGKEISSIIEMNDEPSNEDFEKTAKEDGLNALESSPKEDIVPAQPTLQETEASGAAKAMSDAADMGVEETAMEISPTVDLSGVDTIDMTENKEVESEKSAEAVVETVKMDVDLKEKDSALKSFCNGDEIDKSETAPSTLAGKATNADVVSKESCVTSAEEEKSPVDLIDFNDTINNTCEMSQAANEKVMENLDKDNDVSEGQTTALEASNANVVSLSDETKDGQSIVVEENGCANKESSDKDARATSSTNDATAVDEEMPECSLVIDLSDGENDSLQPSSVKEMEMNRGIGGDEHQGVKRPADSSNGCKKKVRIGDGTNGNADSLSRNTQRSERLDNQVDCINMQCESGNGLCIAPVAILTYYGVRRDKNVLQRVCDACALIAEKHYRKLCDMAKNRIPILHADFPASTDDIVVMDKVEEICDSEEYFSAENVAMIEENLIDVLSSAVEKYDLNYQVKESVTILEKKFDKLTDSVAEINAEFKKWEEELAQMRNDIYELYTPRIRELPPVDLTDPDAKFETLLPLSQQFPNRVMGKRDQLPKCILPPAVVVPSEMKEIEALEEISNKFILRREGPLDYPTLEKHSPVYILKGKMFGPWHKGVIWDIARRPVWGPETSGLLKTLSGPPGVYNVKFDDTRHGLARVLSGKSLAYTEPSKYAYPVQTRIIAKLRNPDDPNSPDAFYVGIIGEPEKQINKNRYLVFFEHGFAQYVSHDKILPVCEVSQNVCDDLAKECRDFVAGYLSQYPERPMVRLQVGQFVRTEWNGKWWQAKVAIVDASMAFMHFEQANRDEWIYRGSTRFKPLYSELVKKHRSLGTSFLKKRNMPYVEYNVEPDNDENNASRNVAKKSTTTVGRSTSQAPTIISNVPPKMFERMEYPTKGYVRQIDLSKRVRSRNYVPHQCNSTCISWTSYTQINRRNIPPLVFPLTVGYSRLIHKTRGKRAVGYVTPCGLRLRNMAELRIYLLTTNCELGVDYFDFDHWVRVTDEFHLEKSMYKTFIEDISNGAESMTVSCVNEIVDIWPPLLKYLTKRLPQEGVNLNTDTDFMIHCDCIDDCSRKENCACWKLTIAGTAQGPEGVVDPSIGYQYRRLPEPVTTGIYECHAGCRCRSTCLNRVVQHPISQRLQVFRTLHKGWGLRTLSDIPLGAFICIYVGRLNTEAKANEDGRMYGDEYLAELDYIEVVEQFKEGFESDVPEDEKDSEGEEEDEDRRRVDREYVPDIFIGGHDAKTKRTTRGSRKADEFECIDLEETAMDSEDQILTPSSKFTANVDDSEDNGKKRKSVRELLGDGADDVYIMDAKLEGNIGRYLNHSCQPNVFVQNVFVDTHDIRFPWIAFFALSHIRAGTELTWDYNYNIGMVPGKVLYCYCGTPDCRGRLL